MARTGVPTPYFDTKFSKLRRFPNIGRISGSPEVVKKFGSLNQPASVLRPGCCPTLLLLLTPTNFESFVTSERGKPVIMAARDLLARPPSRVTRLVAICTARALIREFSSCTEIPTSNIRSRRGSRASCRALKVASLILSLFGGFRRGTFMYEFWVEPMRLRHGLGADLIALRDFRMLIPGILACWGSCEIA
jgi:hypothetical protein